MADAKNKTQIMDQSAEAFVNSLPDEQQRADNFRILEMMKRITGEEPKMWGATIIGFGLRHLKYDSGQEMDWMVIGFSPRKANLTFYIGLGGDHNYNDQLGLLGKHKTGKGCLYINRLSNINESVLEELVAVSYSQNRE